MAFTWNRRGVHTQQRESDVDEDHLGVACKDATGQEEQELG